MSKNLVELSAAVEVLDKLIVSGEHSPAEVEGLRKARTVVLAEVAASRAYESYEPFRRYRGAAEEMAA